jgi:autophagy-related protein 5
MSSSVEARLQTELWRGAIPVEIHLAPDDVASLAPPAPVFALIPRGAYLPVWHDTAPDGPRAAFADSLAPGRDAQPPWFETHEEGLPLRWSVPAGVLYDVFRGAAADAPSADESTLPWRLTAHYRAMTGPHAADEPAFRCGRVTGAVASDATSAAKAHFFNALKEATHVSRGSAKPVMAMSRAARENLWRSVVEGDRALADAAEEELEAPAARGESSSDQAPPIEGDPATTRRNGGAKPRRVPLRAYVVRTPAPRLRGGGGSLRSWDDVRVYSAPVELDEDGSRTVGDALASVCVDDVAKTLGDGAVVVAQGVGLSLATSLEEAHARLKGADHFLHVVVRVPEG